MEYRALTNEGFYYLETKRVTRVILNNPEISKEELYEYIQENDLIESNNERNLRQKFNTIYKRVTSLNNYLLERLVEESPDIGKFINLFGLIQYQKIYLDFLNEVVREKYILLDKTVEDEEFRNFITLKADQVEAVENWTDGSRKKIIVKIKNYLVEAGYLIRKDNRGKTFGIARPLIPADILGNIKMDYGENIVKVFLLER